MTSHVLSLLFSIKSILKIELLWIQSQGVSLNSKRYSSCLHTKTPSTSCERFYNNPCFEFVVLSKVNSKNRITLDIDSGGQPQFQEVLPLFTHQNSINIVSFQLRKRLYDKPRFEFVALGKVNSKNRITLDIDSGGQPQFQEVLLLFAHQNSINIVREVLQQPMF